jgi:hypothetical protein
MNMKKVLVLVMAMAFTASVASVSMAAIEKCTVKAVAGKTVTLECKKASLKVGDDVTLKKAIKKKAIEGC